MVSTSLDAIRRNLRLILALTEASLSEHERSATLVRNERVALEQIRFDAQLLLSTLMLEARQELCAGIGDEVGERNQITHEEIRATRPLTHEEIMERVRRKGD